MSDQRASLDSAIERLQQERDRLRLKLHLGSMEAKDEYERLSARVDELRARYEPVTDAVGQTAENVFGALRLAADELVLGFGRVRKLLNDDE